ncbi:MAG: SDR family oxidoreductase [Bacteroidales bacterium]
MNIQLNDKTVLVTGASRGIGRAIATSMADAGAQIAIHFHRSAEEASRLKSRLKGSGHITVQADMKDPQALEKMTAKVMDSFKRIDVLVNNAGIYEETDSLSLSYREFINYFKNTMDTNLSGPAWLSFLAARSMKENGGGKIINITSRGAFRGEPNAYPYGASKAGLNALGQSMAKDLASHNIKVFAIAPGFVETDMTKHIFESPLAENFKKQSPLNRTAEPEEVARLATYLAGDHTDYLTGCIIDINGASYLRS